MAAAEPPTLAGVVNVETTAIVKVPSRNLYEQIRTAEDGMWVWLWCDTNRLRYTDTVGWKLLSHYLWDGGDPPGLDSDETRYFGFEEPGYEHALCMSTGPDEVLDVIYDVG